MSSTLVTNLVAYSAQIACIVAAGSLLPVLLRIDAPSVRYVYWRGLLALCLVLPFVQEWRAVTPASVATVMSAVSDVSRAGDRPATAATSYAAPDWLGIAALVLAAGVLARLAWVAMSLLRLRRMRSAGRPAAPCAEHIELQRALGTHAEIRYAAGLQQPVTFGVRWPVVLLPEATLEQPAEIQHAVLCHELIHVERHDWAWVLVEELVRAVLWFHPAVWWIVSRVQAAREEVVDTLAVRITGGRRRYIEALMVFADAAPVVPAAAFSRRRHLFRRILLLSRETVVSPSRLAVSCAVMAGVLLAGSWYAIDAFPLSQVPSAAGDSWGEPGAQERRAQPVTPENPLPRRLHGVGPRYPAEALAVRAVGEVTLVITLDGTGRVVEARRVGSGISFPTPEASRAAADSMTTLIDSFARSAVDAVRQWVYEPPLAAPVSLFVHFKFDPDRDAVLVYHGATAPARNRGAVIAGPPPPPPPPPPPTAALDRSAPGGASAASASRPLDAPRQGLEGVDYLTRRLQQRAVPPAGPSPQAQTSMVVTAPTGRDRERDLTQQAQNQDDLPLPGLEPQPTALLQEPAAPPFAQDASSSAQPVRVGGNIRAPRKIKDVRPVYPAIAASARVTGIVIIEATIGADGRVVEARVIRSIPLLDEAALEAVRQWEFTPTLLNGAPTPIVMSVTVNFAL